MTMQIENNVPDNGQPAAPTGAAAAPTNQPPEGQPQGAQQQPEGQPAANPDTSAATPPADGTTQQPAGEQQPGEQDPGERDDQGRFKSKVQKRIDELTHARHQAEREAARWRSIAEGRQAPPAAPSRSDFATDEDFQAAMIDHRVDVRAQKVAADTAQQTAQQYQQDAERAVDDTYNQRVQAAAARMPDFVDVVGKADIKITADMLQALKESEHGPDIVYQLAKNPEEAQRLASMSTRQLDREIGRMEAALAAKSATAAPPAAPAARTTNAPPPAKPGAPAAAPANTDPANMNQEQYEAWRKAQGSRYIR